MEEKINREIMEYKENVGGLTLRQLLWTLVAVALSILIYSTLSPVIGSDAVSWFCILAAIPPVLLGFTSWHKMSAEQIISVCLRYIITPKQLCFRSVNQFDTLLQGERNGICSKR